MSRGEAFFRHEIRLHHHIPHANLVRCKVNPRNDTIRAKLSVGICGSSFGSTGPCFGRSVPGKDAHDVHQGTRPDLFPRSLLNISLFFSSALLQSDAPFGVWVLSLVTYCDSRFMKFSAPRIAFTCMYFTSADWSFTASVILLPTEVRNLPRLINSWRRSKTECNSRTQDLD
jgi:hypothetical protein